MLVISMTAVVAPRVIRSVIWITPVVAVIAAWVIPIPISRISVAVTISGRAESYPDSSDPD
jgi:uncharacterized membrane protein